MNATKQRISPAQNTQDLLSRLQSDRERIRAESASFLYRSRHPVMTDEFEPRKSCRKFRFQFSSISSARQFGSSLVSLRSVDLLLRCFRGLNYVMWRSWHHSRMRLEVLFTNFAAVDIRSRELPCFSYRTHKTITSSHVLY